jgi:hypothetical protein
MLELPLRNSRVFARQLQELHLAMLHFDLMTQKQNLDPVALASWPNGRTIAPWTLPPSPPGHAAQDELSCFLGSSAEGC